MAAIVNIVTLNRKLGHVRVIELKQGETFFLRYMLPDNIERIASVMPAPRGKGKVIRPYQRTLVVVEELYDGLGGAKHARFARAIASDEDLTKVRFVGDHKGTPYLWGRLRAACNYQALTKVRALGGFDLALYFEGEEQPVGDFAWEGSSGWIIQKEEVNYLLRSLPKIRPSGIVKDIYVHYYKSRWSLRPVGDTVYYIEDPRNSKNGFEEPFWSYHSDFDGWRNQNSLYRVRYDEGDGRVISIHYLTPSAEEPKGIVGWGYFNPNYAEYETALGQKVPRFVLESVQKSQAVA